MRKILYLLPLFIVFTSCGPPEYTIVADPVWMERWDKNAPELDLVKALEKESGKNISVMPGDIPEDRSYIEEIIVRSRGEKLLLSPLYSAAVDPEMAARTGKKVILTGFSSMKGGEFSTSIQLSRIKAFREAGEECARLLMEDPGTYGTQAAALFYTATPRRREEMNEFKAGFSSLMGLESLKVYEVSAIDDRARVRPFLDEVKRSNIGLVMLAGSRLNMFCVEECSKENAYMVLEEGTGFEVFQENILGSIEFDIYGLMKTAVTIPFPSLSGTVVEADFILK